MVNKLLSLQCMLHFLHCYFTFHLKWASWQFHLRLALLSLSLAPHLSSPGWYLIKSPSFALIGLGNMWSLIKSIFSSEIAFISRARFFGPSTKLNLFGKRNSSLWVTKCQRAELQKRERKSHPGKQLKNTCRKRMCVYVRARACLCARIDFSQSLCSYIIYTQV